MNPNSEASGLTDDELLALVKDTRLCNGQQVIEFARAVVAAHEAKRPSTSAEAVALAPNDEALMNLARPYAADGGRWPSDWLAAMREAIAWSQQAHPAPSTTVAAGEARKLVAQQAEDDGLWFIAESASEACLQDALRKLHAAVEATPPTDPKADLLRRMAEALEKARKTSMGAVSHVGRANYAEREREARQWVCEAFDGLDQLLKEARQ